MIENLNITAHTIPSTKTWDTDCYLNLSHSEPVNNVTYCNISDHFSLENDSLDKSEVISYDSICGNSFYGKSIVPNTHGI